MNKHVGGKADRKGKGNMIDTSIKINLMATPPRKARKPRRKARHSRNNEGSLHLIPLPLGLGLNYGKGFSSRISLRSWEWARFDFADHEPIGSERWADVQLWKTPEASHPFAVWFDDWDNRRFWRRMARKAAKR